MSPAGNWGNGRTSPRARQRQAEIYLARVERARQLSMGSILEAFACAPDATEEDIAAWEEWLAENDGGGGLIINRGAGTRFGTTPIDYDPAPGPGIRQTDEERARALTRSAEIRDGVDRYLVSVGYRQP